MTPEAKVAQILAEGRYCTVATCDQNTPWATPVYYSFDEHLHFYFLSNRDSRHVQNLQKNPKVSLAVFNSTLPVETIDGVYLEGTAAELTTAADVQHAMDVAFAKVRERDIGIYKPDHTPADFMGASNSRFYRITPTALYKLHDTEDVRVELNLAALKNELFK